MAKQKAIATSWNAIERRPCSRPPMILSNATDGELAARAERILAGDRTALARAITLIESRRPEDQVKARALVQNLLPHTGRAIRLGITGAPGVGKSTVIDALGSNLTAAGHRVAVATIDPSSTRTGGSILGDKTRMARLSIDPQAFIRPSPSAGALGGVAARTRETILLCEAAGFDVVVVETVGIGQSETAVADMTDFFLVLILPGAGDELQGMKKGVLELADLIAVNKADSDPTRAAATAAEYRAALHLLQPASSAWSPRVVEVSGLRNEGLDAIWASVRDHHSRLQELDGIAAKRRLQQIKWMWSMLEDRLQERLRRSPKVRRRLPDIEAAVGAGRLSPENGAAIIAQLVQL
jgi:LAO/AO transport system kinase